MIKMNWLPSDYDEFRRMAERGAVRLNMMPEHRGWASRNGFGILPASQERKLIAKMMSDETFYRMLVHRKGVDLILDMAADE
ncbi:hypothetical protein [Maricaulis virginensis]|uniref:hypothetical protein n=1 Tax=Maricaulis virginensis TaxID=144022 RepID=UPI0022F27B85|nr:hypothetical protein [Maricaulis virginensis]